MGWSCGFTLFPLIHPSPQLTCRQLYHPDDLKGKGEPSFTIERGNRKMKQRVSPEGMEMTTPYRQRSYSNGAFDPSGMLQYGETSGTSMHRSNTTGKSGKLSEGLKKRLGSLRRMKGLPAEGMH